VDKGGSLLARNRDPPGELHPSSFPRLNDFIMAWKTPPLVLITTLTLVPTLLAETPAKTNAALIHEYARQRVREAGRAKTSAMPTWLKTQRDLYRDRMALTARKSFEQTGIWYLARGAARDTDEQETEAVWGSLLSFGDLRSLPAFTEANRLAAIDFWRSWQNLQTGRLYNPLYQDPQHPEIKRSTPGNRADYSPEKINVKYVPAILAELGAELPRPVNIAARADTGVDTFDELWKWLPQWATSPAGAFPVQSARQLDDGNLEKIPQVEAGMGALLRAYNRQTGMWRPEPLERFPWSGYDASSGFKIIARICGYVGMENFPQDVLKTAIDHLIAHRHELHAQPSTARNYGETMAHFLTLTDYRRDELLDAMEECLDGFRSPDVWATTGTGSYAVFGSGLIGAFMNWRDLPFDQALQEYVRFEHGCTMKWRFVVDPYGNWVNVLPKEPEAIYGHPKYDVRLYGLKARNKTHWSKTVAEVVPQRDAGVGLLDSNKGGDRTLPIVLTREQLARLKAPYLKATWSGAYDVYLNGKLVKNVRYNLPDAIAGWYVPPAAAETLHVGENTITLKLIGPGKDQNPGAPRSKSTPFARLGLIDWN
jgi:hypothetical protein